MLSAIMRPTNDLDQKGTPVLTKEFPDHHDATIILQLYDLRREAVMRESRAAIYTRFLPANAEEAVAILKHDHPLTAAFRQVVGYWEMVYGMMKWGILHADFALESNGEGLVLFAKVEPYLAQVRAQKTGVQFTNAEWVAGNTTVGKAMMERFRQRFAPAAGKR